MAAYNGWLRGACREANQLVEEFMLLANIQVALTISDAFPDRSLLRRHPEPNARKLAAAAAAAKDVVSTWPLLDLSPGPSGHFD